MTANAPQPIQSPVPAPPPPRRSPEEWAMLVGSVVRCAIVVLFWATVMIVSLGLATVVITAVWRGVTLAMNTLGL